MKFHTSSALSLIVVASLVPTGCSKPSETSTPGVSATEAAMASPVAQTVTPAVSQGVAPGATATPAPANPAHGEPGHVHDDAGITAPPRQRSGDPKEQIGTKPNSWFEFTELDMGTFFLRETATGDFRFKNPSSEPRRFTAIRQSCNCTKSTFKVGGREYFVTDESDAQDVIYEVKYQQDVRIPERVTAIEIGPEEEGVITVEMKLTGPGSRHASIGLSIDDPELEGVNLMFHAMGAVYFTVTPEEVNLNTMRYDETREFTVQVTSPVMGDFEIVRHEAPPGMKVTYEKIQQGGDSLYTIKGTYGPLQEGAANGGTVVFYTDKDGMTFDVRVLALVEGPLKMTPGFLPLGLVRAGKSGSKSATISAGPDFDLQVTKLEPKELTFAKEFLNASWTKNEAGDVVVTVEVLPGVPSGTVVRGELVVHLNHPAAESKPILFNGMVR